MNSSFGVRLRQQRERREIALADIAERTKIKLALLEGLERDDVSHWPAGIFRRSYIRAYASAVGLDPDSLLREFLECHPDPVDHTTAALAAAKGVSDDPSRRRPPTRLRFLLGSAFGLPSLRGHQPDDDIPIEKPSFYDQGSIAPDTSAADVVGSTVSTPLPVEPYSSPVNAASGGVLRETGPDEPSTGAASANIARPVDGGAPDDTLSTLHEVQLSATLAQAADLCTRLAYASDPREVVPVLEDAARLLDAVGLIVWIFDARLGALRPVVSVGYGDDVLGHLVDVRPDSDNAIAAAFRLGGTRVVNGSARETGALVIPLPTPAGSAGVLALELRNGGEQREPVLAFATILAAQMATLIGYPPLVDERSGEDAPLDR